MTEETGLDEVSTAAARRKRTRAVPTDESTAPEGKDRAASAATKAAKKRATGKSVARKKAATKAPKTTRRKKITAGEAGDETAKPEPDKAPAKESAKEPAAPSAPRDAAEPERQRNEPAQAPPPAAPAARDETRDAAPAPRPDSETAPSAREDAKPAEQRHPSGGEGGPKPHHLSKKAERRKFWKEKKKRKQQEQQLGPPVHGEGLLEISGKGFGFLRQRGLNFKPAPNDIFVTPEMVRSYGLRDGLWIEGETREGHRGPQLTSLDKINGKAPDKYRNLPIFEELTAVNPNKRIILETDRRRYTTRIIDMMAPVGRGQRGLIVAPPRTGKTTLLQHIAEAVLQNHESMKLILMLIDERPEEVTELTRALPGAEIFASSNDSDVKNHTRIAQLAIERAKRLVEAGEHVFILLDSITRLTRAFNNAIRGGGRTMSGGYDIRAFEVPRRLFAAARNTREAGSLTIVATALIETGNKGDELVFQEFKGTGNMELVLDRAISQQYIYPAVNIFKSGTRREELLLPPHQLEKIYVIRRGLSGHKPVEAIERLLSFCERFPNNAQMLVEIPAHA